MVQTRWLISLSGVVQGIGLRPLLHQLSEQYQLSGFVQNTHSDVTLEWQGCENHLQSAKDALLTQLAPWGKILMSQKTLPLQHECQFTIHSSTKGEGKIDQSLISPDMSTCVHCLEELFDPTDRRFQYPLINCAQCGPRYTICHQLPYDREHTAMAGFPLCKTCQAEYSNPSNRRFHAQTISCWDCGPKLWLSDREGQIIARQQTVVQAACDALKSGLIIAIKGIGGFHLMALASHTEAIKKLRLRKHRADKPFAVLAQDLTQASKIGVISDLEQQLLTSATAPIVLLKIKTEDPEFISPLVAPKQTQYGIMLAYTPLHHLILSRLPGPLIATSANITGEPICYDNQDAFNSLHDIADLWLFHEREIAHPLEDSIFQVTLGKMQCLRRARGYIPFTLPAPHTDHSYLALGGHLKNSIALHYHNRFWISPYIGDLTSLKSIKRFKNEIENFSKITPDPILIADPHPEYASNQSDLPTPLSIDSQPKMHFVQHHLAHVFAVIAEHQISDPILGFAWDGLGLGQDNKFWGAETFYIQPHQIDHVATLFPFCLLGGEKAIQEPRRITLGLLHACYGENEWEHMPPHLHKHFSRYEKNILEQLMCNTHQSPICSSMGRLFDGVAFLLNGVAKMSYEGQAAMYLEQLAHAAVNTDQVYPVELYDNQNHMIIDWRPMLNHLLSRLDQHLHPKMLPNIPDQPLNISFLSTLALQFHQWCANVIIKIVNHYQCRKIVLSGGVFQNKLLTTLACESLQRLGYQVYCAEQLPPNDGGLAVGQALAIHYLLKSKAVTPLCV